MSDHRQTDVLILGAGVSGLSLALRLADRFEVTVAAKTALNENASWRAQGGVAAVADPADSFERHVEDTLSAGGGLSHRATVQRIVETAPALIAELQHWGVVFSARDGRFDLTREGGHAARRIIHAGDMTGANISSVLLARAREHPRITLLDNTMAVDLITKRRKLNTFDDRCLGAYLLNADNGRIVPWLAAATVLATGGSGKVYLYTSNPDVATGDGVAMAYRVGCRVVNMEFTQFHPTCLYHPQAKTFLISEAVRGEGGVLLNSQGERFMQAVDERAELAPRDIVARAIDAEMKHRGEEHVLLDISHRGAAFVRERFPHLVEVCAKYGYDLPNAPIPVVPAAHYQCGGVWTDLHGCTEIPGLYAVGEVAFTGMHGANRLASNSLLECLAMAKFAAVHIAAGTPPSPVSEAEGVDLSWVYGDAVRPDEEGIVSHNWDELRRAMTGYLGIVRTDRRIQRARRRIANLAEEVLEYYWGVIPSKDLLELRNLVQTAWIIVECARRRRESRGLHYNLDTPELLPRPRDTILDPVSHYP